MSDIATQAHRPANKFPPLSEWKLFSLLFSAFFLGRLLLFRWTHIFGHGESLLESFLVSLGFTVLLFFGLRKRVRFKR
jgi:hypothetical protein